MSILFLSTHLNTGGITSYLWTLGKGLQKSGQKVFVASSGGNMVESFEASGIQHIHLNIRTKSELSPKVYKAVAEVKRILKDHAVDVIHAQTRVTQVLAALVSRSTGVPYVTTCHGFFKPKLGRTLFPCWGRRVIAISRPVVEHLQKDFKVPQERIAYVPNGVDVADFMPVAPETRRRARLRWQIYEEPVIGIIARLSDIKGHEYIIRAMPKILNRFPQARLLIVGEGPEEANIKKLVQDLRITANIMFSKTVNQTGAILPVCDVFVMPSMQEGLGLSVLEAQAAGIPVVASRVGGLPDVIEDGKTGFLVEPKDSDGLADAVCTLIADRNLAGRMAKDAREFVVAHFSAEVMARKTYDVYGGVVR